MKTHELVITFAVFIYVQVIIICAYVLVGISSGMSHAHTAVLLPQLKAANSSMSVDDYTGSWIGESESILA
jgi:hypothetical protein